MQLVRTGSVIAPSQKNEVLIRFGCKAASLGRILPQVAGPVLGGYAGRMLGSRVMPNNPNMGEMLGTIGGLTAGRYLSEEAFAPKEETVPAGAPYAIDPSTNDIPPWALLGARFIAPAIKTSSAERAQDIVLGEIPGYSAVEGYRQQGIPGAVKGTLGQVAGGVGGGAIGLGTGMLLKHLLGRDINVPLVNLPLSHLLAGVGGTIGATKGFQGSLGLNH